MGRRRELGRGLSLIELVAVIAIAMLALAMGAPALGRMRVSARMAAGARHLALTLHALRWKSVTRGAGHGMLFERDTAGWFWREVRDGNGNGLRTAEVRDGTDPVVSGPVRLEDQVPGVRLGLPPLGPLPAIPPRGGRLEMTEDPVRIGKTNLLAFSPLGGGSSGTIYITDGRQALRGLVLYGRTARLRVWRYDAESGRWTR